MSVVVVLVEAVVIADLSGIALSRWRLGGGNRTNFFVFSRKVSPGDCVGNPVCATGAAGARGNDFGFAKLHCKKVSELVDCAVPMCLVI